jgi:hypothetical protein
MLWRQLSPDPPPASGWNFWSQPCSDGADEMANPPPPLMILYCGANVGVTSWWPAPNPGRPLAGRQTPAKIWPAASPPDSPRSQLEPVTRGRFEAVHHLIHKNGTITLARVKTRLNGSLCRSTSIKATVAVSCRHFGPDCQAQYPSVVVRCLRAAPRQGDLLSVLAAARERTCNVGESYWAVLPPSAALVAPVRRGLVCQLDTSWPYEIAMSADRLSRVFRDL